MKATARGASRRASGRPRAAQRRERARGERARGGEAILRVEHAIVERAARVLAEHRAPPGEEACRRGARRPRRRLEREATCSTARARGGFSAQSRRRRSLRLCLACRTRRGRSGAQGGEGEAKRAGRAKAEARARRTREVARRGRRRRAAGRVSNAEGGGGRRRRRRSWRRDAKASRRVGRGVREVSAGAEKEVEEIDLPPPRQARRRRQAAPAGPPAGSPAAAAARGFVSGRGGRGVARCSTGLGAAALSVETPPAAPAAAAATRPGSKCADLWARSSRHLRRRWPRHGRCGGRRCFCEPRRQLRRRSNASARCAGRPVARAPPSPRPFAPAALTESPRHLPLDPDRTNPCVRDLNDTRSIPFYWFDPTPTPVPTPTIPRPITHHVLCSLPARHALTRGACRRGSACRSCGRCPSSSASPGRTTSSRSPRGARARPRGRGGTPARATRRASA